MRAETRRRYTRIASAIILLAAVVAWLALWIRRRQLRPVVDPNEAAMEIDEGLEDVRATNWDAGPISFDVIERALRGLNLEPDAINSFRKTLEQLNIVFADERNDA